MSDQHDETRIYDLRDEEDSPLPYVVITEDNHAVFVESMEMAELVLRIWRGLNGYNVNTGKYTSEDYILRNVTLVKSTQI